MLSEFKFKNMCGISAIYILDKKGRVLISRHFNSDVPDNIYDTFNKKILQFDEFTIKPIIKDKDNNLFYFHKHSDLNFLAISRKNNNALMVFAFLKSLVDVLTSYLNILEEESVRDNFIIIYELLDEMMDNGYPQLTQVKLLKTFIKNQSHQLKSSIFEGKKSTLPSNQQQKELSNQITGFVPDWRSKGIKYSKNEFYLDVVEKLSMLIDSNNKIVKSQITGNVRAKSQLSGFPNLKLGLNDKTYYEVKKRITKNKCIEFDDFQFHKCVNLERFQNERQITFIPPDGQFQLLNYRLDAKIKPLFTVDVFINEETQRKIDYTIKIRSNYKEKSLANNVNIFVPVPDDVESYNFKHSSGDTAYLPQKNAIKWSLKQVPGHKEFVLFSEVKLPIIVSPNRKNFKKQLINVDFEIPYFTVSGFQVRYLKITEKSGYKSSPWVKYLTQNGQYQIRMK